MKSIEKGDYIVNSDDDDDGDGDGDGDGDDDGYCFYIVLIDLLWRDILVVEIGFLSTVDPTTNNHPFLAWQDPKM